jgi:hypothetical protein
MCVNCSKVPAEKEEKRVRVPMRSGRTELQSFLASALPASSYKDLISAFKRKHPQDVNLSSQYGNSV